MSERLEPDYGLLDRSGAGASMFYPQRDDSPPPAGAEDHLIEVAPDVRVAARFYVGDPTWPALLYFHGNGEIAGDHDGIAPLYHEINVNLFVAEFRGYGKSNGVPSAEALVEDAHPIAARFHAILDAAGGSAARLVMGRSLGAHPALELAANATERLRGVVIESGAGNLRRSLERQGLLDTEAGGLLAAAHEAKVRSIRMPALLIHGEWDELVPLANAEALHALLDGTRRELVVIPSAGHNDILWAGRERYFDAIASFVARSTGVT